MCANFGIFLFHWRYNITLKHWNTLLCHARDMLITSFLIISRFFTELKIYHLICLYITHMTISTLLILVASMSYINLVYGPARHESFVAQGFSIRPVYSLSPLPLPALFFYIFLLLFFFCSHFFALSPRSERLEQAINNAVLEIGFVSTVTPPTTALFKKRQIPSHRSFSLSRNKK